MLRRHFFSVLLSLCLFAYAVNKTLRIRGPERPVNTGPFSGSRM